MNNRKFQVNWNETNLKPEKDMFTDDDILLLEIKHNKHSGRYQANYFNTNEGSGNLISEL